LSELLHSGALYKYLKRDRGETIVANSNNEPTWQKRLVDCYESKSSVSFSLKLMNLLIQHKLKMMLYVNGLHAAKPFISRPGT